MKYCALICCMILYVFSLASGKKIKPPIPDELKEACKGAGGGRRSCLDEKLKEYCVNPSNIDTITCKIVRLKTLIPDSIADECTLVSSDDYEDEEDCIEEKLEGFCQDIDNHDTTACKCASSRTKRKERRKCLRQQMETFCDIAEHSGTKACRKFICSSAGDKAAKKECKAQKLREYCEDGDNSGSIQCKRVACQEIDEKKERKKCIKAQMVEYCNDDANVDTLTCRMMGIKEAKKMCVQKTLEDFCQDDGNSNTRVCKRLKDKNVD